MLFYGIFNRGITQHLVLEYFPLGDLTRFMKIRTVDIYQILWFSIHIARGMSYIHSMGINHNDLAARNVLVGLNNATGEGHYIAKISGLPRLFNSQSLIHADFGLSSEKLDGKDYDYGLKMKKVAIRWSAPEVLTNQKCSEQSDVWSFGVTVWEMYEHCQKIPYWKFDENHLVKEFVVEKGGRLDRPSPCPDHVWKIIESCWTLQSRPLFVDLIQQLTPAPQSNYISDK